ncbi:MAG: c-type cytochrome, partial [Anaerolineales bacterium]
MLAAVNLPGPSIQNGTDPAYIRGGRLYTAWDRVTNLTTPIAQQNPLWPKETPNQVPAVLTWRCVNCHGWDYRGSEGKTLGAVFRTMGYPDLFGYTAKPIEEILPALNGELNPDHDFTAYLNEEDLKDLAAFLSQGLVVPELIADPGTFKVTGMRDNGEDAYFEQCAYCHGTEGEEINLNTDEKPVFLGDVAWGNPWLMVHTIRFGHIRTVVPAGIRLGLPFSTQIDIAAYAQSLPTADIITGPDYQDIDLSAQANTAMLAYGAAAVALLVFLAVGITLYLNKKELDQQALK